MHNTRAEEDKKPISILQRELAKINASALRQHNISANEYQFITVSRDQEIIDTNMLSTSGLLSNGIVVEAQHMLDGQYSINHQGLLQNYSSDDIQISGASSTILQLLNKTESDSASEMQGENNSNIYAPLESIHVSFNKNNLPPLTPIRKIRASKTMSRDEQQHTEINFDFVDTEQTITQHTVSAEPAIGAPKRGLPHKKRISTSKDTKIIHEEIQAAPKSPDSIQIFTCQLCGNETNSQLEFFSHLKSHYEPPNNDKKLQMQNSLASECYESFNPNQSDSGNSLQTGGHMQEMEETVITTLAFDKVKEEEVGDTEGMLVDSLEISRVNQNEIKNDESEEDSNAWLDEEITNLSSNDDVELFPTISDPIMTDYQEPTEEDVETATPEPQKPKRKKRSPKRAKKETDSGRVSPIALSCQECEKVFKSKYALYYHKRTHAGIRSHVCETCGKGFFNSSALKVHSRLHSGSKPYTCEFCNRAFRQWGDMKYHITSIHTDEKKFQCEFCGKDFARRYSLSVHRRIHTGERNYVCDICNKAFRASSYLRNHRRIHTGEKPHECPTCQRKFRVRSDMKRHMTIHNHDRSRKSKGKPAVAIEEMAESDSNASDNSIKEEKYNVLETVVERTEETYYDSNSSRPEKVTRNKKAQIAQSSNVIAPPNVVVKAKQNESQRSVDPEVISQTDGSMFVWQYVPT